MAVKAISLADAKKNAWRDFGSRTIKWLGFEERQVGPRIVNILYYSVEYTEAGTGFTNYRMDVYVNGRRSNGISL